MRQQLLDVTAQKDKAALSMSKGLQNRRLPSHFVTKIPDDYTEVRRRRFTNDDGIAGHPTKSPKYSHDDTNYSMTPELTEAERQEKVILW